MEGLINKKELNTTESVSSEILVTDNVELPDKVIVPEESFIPTETVVLKENQTLRLLSLELFGDREFWVYIYQENMDVIQNPNLVYPGLELKVPIAAKYNIDSRDSNSISAAKEIGEIVLQKF